MEKKAIKEEYKLSPCNVCDKREHVREAKYCARCGTKLDQTIKYH